MKGLVQFNGAAGACLLALCASVAGAAEINTTELSENGWYSDDTRADGAGTEPVGTNLISDTLTDDPEATDSGTPAHDADILRQVTFGDPPAAPPAGTHPSAVHLTIAAGAGSGKSQISHRKDDATGHGPGSAFGSGFTAEYSWMGDGTPTVTASLKFGIKTSDFGITGMSSRTGENVWDKVLIYEPGNLNGGTSDGTWQTETVTWSSGQWWLFDRTNGAGSIGHPMTLQDMSTSALMVGGRPISDIYALITAPGAIITSVQVGIGSGNPGGSVYVNQIETNAYRDGDVTTFGLNRNATPDNIFGSGNANGGYTPDRQAGVELAMRGKLRFDATGQPQDVYNLSGDNTYVFEARTLPNGHGFIFAQPPTYTPEWNIDWSVNTDYDGSSGLVVEDLTYEIGFDFDPGPATDFFAFDPISPPIVLPYTSPVMLDFADHAFGTNATGSGAGVEATDAPSYLALRAANNVAQNSWNLEFFNDFPPTEFMPDPSIPGRFDAYLAAFDGNGDEVARTEIVVLTFDGASLSLEVADCPDDADAGEAGTQVAIEVWMRNLDTNANGFNAFLAYDDTNLTYRQDLSSYTSSPFPAHFTPIVMAEAVAGPGELYIDGSTMPDTPGDDGTDEDRLLATLVFDVVNECVTTTLVSFTTPPAPTFGNELAFDGVPLPTSLKDTGAVTLDDTPPSITCPADITVPADSGSSGGCAGAVVVWADPVVSDNCSAAMDIDVVCEMPSGSFFPAGTTMVTCTATDECGNESSCTFDVTVTETNLIDVTVELVGSMPATRCIHFVTDDCGNTADVQIVFTDHDANAATPVRGSAIIEVECGVWTMLCAKDERHTLWGSSSLTDGGVIYTADSVISLEPGDNDNDGDVDINDVTYLIFTFGDVVPAQVDCPDLVRETDLDNNGAVGSNDYSLLSANWLQFSTCGCTMAATAPGWTSRQGTLRASNVAPWVAERTDLNHDGLIDDRDVAIFEKRHGLPDTLSSLIRETNRR